MLGIGTCGGFSNVSIGISMCGVHAVRSTVLALYFIFLDHKKTVTALIL